MLLIYDFNFFAYQLQQQILTWGVSYSASKLSTGVKVHLTIAHGYEKTMYSFQVF